MEGFACCLESMCRYIGQTVTIYTTSGGLSGSGFTGVLVSCDAECVRLLCDIGAAPACSIGSSCVGFGTPLGYGNPYGYGNQGYGNFGFAGNPLGSIAVIPTCAIACFTHNAI